MKLEKKLELKQKRIWRIRRKVSGTAARPRVCVSFSNKHLYAQAIDDEAGKTLVYVSSLAKDLKDKKLGANTSSATEIGKVFGEKAKDSGISQVVFDRHGHAYHGRVRAFAEAAREAGLQF